MHSSAATRTTAENTGVVSDHDYTNLFENADEQHTYVPCQTELTMEGSPKWKGGWIGPASSQEFKAGANTQRWRGRVVQDVLKSNESVKFIPELRHYAVFHPFHQYPPPSLCRKNKVLGQEQGTEILLPEWSWEGNTRAKTRCRIERGIYLCTVAAETWSFAKASCRHVHIFSQYSYSDLYDKGSLFSSDF